MPTPFRENLRGIAALIACNIFFLINDTLIKLANAGGVPLGEILFLRGILAAALLFPIVVASGAHRQARLLLNRSVFWRCIAEIAASVLFLIALFHLPFANINAILQVVPLMLTAAAAIFLGEEVGWRRWLAIAVGFAGVMIVIRPGLGDYNAFGLIALASMAFITLRDLMTRTMPRGLPALLLTLVTATIVALSGPAVSWALDERWVMPDFRNGGLIVASTVFVVGGYLTAIEFMRHGNIAVVAPFRYLVVLWAIIVGYLVWGEVPDLPMLAGTALIIGTGIYTFYRERRLARRAELAAEPFAE